MDYHSLSRRQLQLLCKKHGVPANSTNVQMADALSELLNPRNPPSRVGGSGELIPVQCFEASVENNIASRTAQGLSASRRVKLTGPGENEILAASKPVHARTVRTRKCASRESKYCNNSEKECDFAADSEVDSSQLTGGCSRAGETVLREDKVRTRSRSTQSGSPIDVQQKEENIPLVGDVFKTCLVSRDSGQVRKKKGPVTFSDILEKKEIEYSIVKKPSIFAAKRTTRSSSKQLFPADSLADNELEGKGFVSSETSHDALTVRRIVSTRSGTKNSTAVTEATNLQNTVNEQKEICHDSAQAKASNSGQRIKVESAAASEPDETTGETTKNSSLKENQVESAPPVRNRRQTRRLPSVPHNKDCLQPKRMKGNAVVECISEEPSSKNISRDLSNEENEVCNDGVCSNPADPDSHGIEKNLETMKENITLEDKQAGFAPRRHSTRQSRILPFVQHEMKSTQLKERVSRKHSRNSPEQGSSVPATRHGTNKNSSIQISEPSEIVGRRKKVAVENIGKHGLTATVDEMIVHCNVMDSAQKATDLELPPVENSQEESASTLNSTELSYGFEILHVEGTEFKQEKSQLTKLATDRIDRRKQETDEEPSATVDEFNYGFTELKTINKEECKGAEVTVRTHRTLEMNGLHEDDAAHNNNVPIMEGTESTNKTPGSEEKNSGKLQNSAEFQESNACSLTHNDEGGMNIVGDNRQTDDVNKTKELQAGGIFSHSSDADTFIYDNKGEERICMELTIFNNLDENTHSCDTTLDHDISNESLVVFMENHNHEVSSVITHVPKQRTGVEGSICEANENHDDGTHSVTVESPGRRTRLESSICEADTYNESSEANVLPESNRMVSANIEENDVQGFAMNLTEADNVDSIEGQSTVYCNAEQESLWKSSVQDIHALRQEADGVDHADDAYMVCFPQIEESEDLNLENQLKAERPIQSKRQIIEEARRKQVNIKSSILNEDLAVPSELLETVSTMPHNTDSKNVSHHSMPQVSKMQCHACDCLIVSDCQEANSSINEFDGSRLTVVEGSEVTELDIETDANLTIVSENAVSKELAVTERIEIATLATLERLPAMESVSANSLLNVQTQSVYTEPRVERMLQENVFDISTSIMALSEEESMRQIDLTLLSLRMLREICRGSRKATRKYSGNVSPGKKSYTNSWASTRERSADNASYTKDNPLSSKRSALKALPTNITENILAGNQVPSSKPVNGLRMQLSTPNNRDGARV